MPVTIEPAPHKANIVSVSHYQHSYSNAETLLKDVSSRTHSTCKELLQSSFSFDRGSPTAASGNGFVHGAIQAYNNHHHLVIRPEDVWFAILSQLSVYINKNAEEVRGKFVNHAGQKELEIISGAGNRYTRDWGKFADDMGLLLQTKVVDPDLRAWIMPSFTTTTTNDKIVASILLMGAMQKYFTYRASILCGLPSVTLLGERADWQEMLSRLEKLKTFGEEPTHWYKLLKTVLLRFVQTFDDPSSPNILDFWQKIAHFTAGRSGPSYYSGWITAFCFWDEDGIMVWEPPQSFDASILRLDNVNFHRIESDKVPPGWSSVPVKVDDNGYKFNATMVAGSVGIKYVTSGEITAENKVGLDTVKAETGWWMFERKR